MSAPARQQHNGTWIRPDTRFSIWLWVPAALFSLMVGAAWFRVPYLEAPWAILLVILATPIPLSFLRAAVLATLQWWRFGDIALWLDRFPPALGGEVSGVVDLPSLAFVPGRQGTVRLTCTQHHVGRHDDHIPPTVEWERERPTFFEAGERGSFARFRFELPETVLPTGDLVHSYVTWRLTVEAELAGIDLDSRFEVPVARRSDQRMLSPEELALAHLLPEERAAAREGAARTARIRRVLLLGFFGLLAAAGYYYGQ